jgi:hypothetical protein
MGFIKDKLSPYCKTCKGAQLVIINRGTKDQSVAKCPDCKGTGYKK